MIDTISNWPTADHVWHIAATSVSLLQQLCTVDNWIFYLADVNVFFVTDLTDKYFIRQIFYKRFLSG